MKSDADIDAEVEAEPTVQEARAALSIADRFLEAIERRRKRADDRMLDRYEDAGRARAGRKP